MEQSNARKKYMLRGCFVALGTNLFLFFIKFLIGTLSGSVAVLADSFNNLSDMGAGAVTLIGFKMAAKPSDAKHPFGHGRIEYISGLIVSFMILLLGTELAGNAVRKIMHPGEVHFTFLTLFVLCLSVPAKLFLGLYTRRIGKKINSSAMEAAGRDSLNDVIVTGATIISAVLSLFTAVPTDGYIGLIVSGFVIFSGIGILGSTLGPLLGQAPPKKLVQEIEKRVLNCPGVTGIHDLIVHNYGPDRFMASAHAEVRADCDILKIHDAIDLTERCILDELDVMITIHIDPIDTDDALTCALREKVICIAKEVHADLSVHDFRIVSGDTHTNLIFDVAVPAALQMADSAIKEEIDARLQRQNPTYFTVITFDRSFL